ncbi:MAG: penicillin-binding protein activator [Sandaracinaceae bacterium]|nr:penicillin-binding protein activator [Sandaracinaceae bacterium]
MRAHTRVGIFASVAITVLFTGCPRGSGQQDFEQFPSLTTSDPQAEADLRLAREAAQAGRTEEAERRFHTFLEDFPADPLVPVAKLGLGRVLLADGRLEAALAQFDQVATAEDPAVSEAGRFYQGVTYHLIGRHAEAIERLVPLVGQTTDPARSSLLLRTLAAAAQRTGETALALDSLDRLVEAPELPDADREEARRQIRAIVADADAVAIERAYAELPRDRFAWQEAAGRAIRLAFDAGNMTRVAEIVAELRERAVPMSDELAELAVRAERTERADPRIIGAIAPLTGRARQIGQAVSRGLMLASGAPLDGPPPPDAPQLVMRDDGGDPARAAAAVEELVSEHRAIAIIGPLEGRAAQLAARRAQDLGVPLLTLVPDPNVTQAGVMAFRLMPGPRDEAAVLLQAARARGATRFAILRPDHAYGRRLGEAFATLAREAGGQVVAEETYAPGATSFGEAISRIAAQQPQALFVPDTGRQLNLIGPALAAAGLWSTPAGGAPPRGGRAITLLAPSVGVDSRILVASRYFQGALFASVFHAESSTDEARAFADAYTARFGAAPDAYAALAYDAFRLVRGAVSAGHTTRRDVAGWLAGTSQPTVGASGGFNASRTPRQAARLLEVRGSAFVPATSIPES